MKQITIKDVVWTKNATCHYDDHGNAIPNDDLFVVIGTLNDVEIGHYCPNHEPNEMCCILNRIKKDGSSVFINRTIKLTKENTNDNYFRQAIVNAYNNYDRIKEIE